MTAEIADPQSTRSERQVWAILGLLFAGWLIYRAVFIGAGSAYVADVNGQYQSATYNDFLVGTAVYSPVRTVGTWVAAFLTLCIFSFLYRDNPFYKFAEAVFVGVSAAYWMVIAFWTVIIPNLLGKIWPSWIQSWAMPGLSPVRDESWWMFLIPLVLGGMLLWRLSPKGAWIARWPLAFIIGSTAGIRLVGFLQADFISQIHNTIVPVVVVTDSEFQFWESVQNILLVISVLSAIVYFFFSVEHTGVVGQVSRIGVWVLMVTFGAAFGYTVMGRIALLAIRFEFLFDDWLWLIDPAHKRLGL
ncbi:hypothetical protein AB1L42_13665 [Thalassoglobus sp. JC818]|uniref:hypothetical protein n=1 Tax=Thalassoglobus sp. JC818 TaxID=3232136 RepID=UPI003458F356